mmetsp:Transcript_45118/g.66389  ORF Transcript_45118/g.66389 Transcript_45118/m.66389 type:complete len:1378 (-) Transcript_45118:165-4298(-)|eukprot:CAMPEP_0195518338 /NCGR_PEP_ID=MMETSP0794_2-20130614/12685_1 /TAXON_ID=515487 /ORGANISM="Stephanopyxis turris, Strain CCMP 815" /LENGTH=1377 /DNA_ID=CAMNT_0040647281 /DNA_START=56 /DNA_END=4189 /DNA_ORIENTATION=-
MIFLTVHRILLLRLLFIPMIVGKKLSHEETITRATAWARRAKPDVNSNTSSVINDHYASKEKARRKLQQFRNPLEETGWTLVAHMDNTDNQMFLGNSNLGRFYSFGTPVENPTYNTPDFQIMFPFDPKEIMFITGDESHWAVTDYQTLLHLIESESGDESPNIEFLVYINGNVEETRGNVLSRTGFPQDPWISMKGSHADAMNNGFIIWGDNFDMADSHHHDYLKVNHGGVNVFVRQFSNPREELAQQLPIKGVSAGPGVELNDASLIYDGIVEPSKWASSPLGHLQMITGNVYIDVDLGDVYDIKRVIVWHFYQNTRQYYSQTVEISLDGLSFQTVYETGLGELGPVETESGQTIDLITPVKGRYIRHSCGRSTSDDDVHFIEIAAFGVLIPRWYPFPEGNGPLYSDALSFCASRPGDLTRLCSFNEICPNRLTPMSKPFNGNAFSMLDQEFGDTQWVPASDYENGWINVGAPDDFNVQTCETHFDGVGSNPAWGTQNIRNPSTSHILCCVDKRPVIGLKLRSGGNILELPEPIPYEPYLRAQDKTGTIEVIDEGAAVELRGNAWKAFPFSYTITSLTAITFSFTLVDVAETHAVCFAVDLSTKSERCFSVGGTQSWGVGAQHKTEVGETKNYIFNVGQYVKGNINYFALVQDNDADESQGLSVFRDIAVYESTRSLSLHQPVYQSSTDSSFGASSAVDGDYNTFTHTTLSNFPWWKVDLQGLYSIGTVKLYNRQNCCQERMSNLKVELLDSNNNVVDTKTYGNTTNKLVVEFNDFNDAVASQVKVSLQGNQKVLSLGEVEIYEKVPKYRQFMGCYADAWDNALPHYVGNHMGFDACAESCWIAGYHYFGRQYTGQCYCGGVAYTDVSFTRYGAAMGCDCDGRNIGSFKNCVYKYIEDPDSETHEYPQVCDNGLQPGDLVVTALNTDTGGQSKPVVVMTTLKDIREGTELYMTDRAIDCEGPGPCVFADFADSYMDGTVKFTAPMEIIAGKTIAYSKHLRPYTKRDVYFIEGNDQYTDSWTEETWSSLSDVNQFHLFSKEPGKDITVDKSLTGDNLMLYCMAGPQPVFLFSMLFTDEPHVGWTAQGDIWGGDLSEGSTGPVTDKRSYAPPSGPALLFNPSTVPNYISPGAVTCSCDFPNKLTPKNTYTCTNGHKGKCVSSEQCVSGLFEHGSWRTACGVNQVAVDWHKRNHWRLTRPDCGLSSQQFFNWATNMTNWRYYTNLRSASITAVDVTDAYRFFCEPEPDRRIDSQHQSDQELAIEEALLAGALNLERYRMDVQMEKLRGFEYHQAASAMRDRRSKYLPDGKTPIKGNEAPQTQPIDPRVPKCFGNFLCKIAHIKEMEAPIEPEKFGENEMYTKRHPLGQDSAFGTFLAVY